MGKYLVFAFALLSYLVFLATFLYLPAFVADVGVPKTINSGVQASWGWAIPINFALIALFAAQHTIMARPAFKAWWTQWVPKPMERSVFVAAASAALLLLFWQWRPMDSVLWSVTHPIAVGGVYFLCILGFLISLYSSFLIDHFELFGLRQAWNYLRETQQPIPRFTVRSLYRHVRHPLMAGLVLLVWATPTMTAGHLFFALMITGYILMGVAFEERDLIAHLGVEYERYRQQTPKLVPRLWAHRGTKRQGAATPRPLPVSPRPID